MKIYWYAPFNNADEVALAERIGRPGDSVVVQSLRTRFGKELPSDAHRYELVRDLPEPAGDDGGRRWFGSRASVAIRCVRKREHVLATTEFDVLHLHTLNTFTDGVAVRALKRKRMPIVLSVHNVREHQRRLPPVVETTLLRPVFRSGDAVIVAHEFLRDQLAAEFGVDQENIYVVPLVVPEVGVVDTSMPETGESPHCLFFGTFRPNKGIPVLLEAIRLLGPDADVRFHFAGRGEAKLEAIVREAANEDSRITCEIGYIPPARAAELYRSASLVVMPYTWFAAQSGVLREAYAFGRPVVVSDVGALGHAVREENTGWVTPPSDPQALSCTLGEALRDHGKRQDAVTAMRLIAQQRSPDRIAATIRAIYDVVCRP
jgi:glycosyltransferase involved in cell wall biosynthesis